MNLCLWKRTAGEEMASPPSGTNRERSVECQLMRTAFSLSEGCNCLGLQRTMWQRILGPSEIFLCPFRETPCPCVPYRPLGQGSHDHEGWASCIPSSNKNALSTYFVLGTLDTEIRCGPCSPGAPRSESPVNGLAG